MIKLKNINYKTDLERQLTTLMGAKRTLQTRALGLGLHAHFMRDIMVKHLINRQNLSWALLAGLRAR